MRILSSNPYGSNKASVLQTATAPREEDLLKFLDYWRGHKAVIAFREVDRTPAGVVFKVALKSNVGWVTKTILDNNAFFSTPIPVAEGIERWSVFIEDANKTSLFSQLDKVGVVSINQISALEFGRDGTIPSLSLTSHLSPRQLIVLKAAVKGGYFDCPRRVDSRELAKQIGIAQSTLLEHLRKAQMKILREVLASP